MIGILGGGLTGLTLGHLLKEKGIDFEILEKERKYSGLLGSLEKDGFTFDYGGSHIIFSKDKEVLNFMLKLLGENKLKNRRNTKILYKGRYVKYPFENGLSDLPEEDNLECLIYFMQTLVERDVGRSKKPGNLKEWCYFTFGKGIAEKYMIPYNEKIWNFPAEKTSLDWVERIPKPPVEDIIKSSLGIETEGYTHQLHFHYPKTGGIESLIRAIRKGMEEDVVTGFTVRRIEKKAGKWVVSDGKTEKTYERIISTIPIFDVIDSLDAPKKIRDVSGRLRYNSLVTVMLGLKTPRINDISWLYIPDRSVLTHRISFPSNYSPHVSPEGKSSVLAEITCNFMDGVWKMKEEDMVKTVVDDLDRLGIIKKNDVCFTEVRKIKYAYIISDLGYRKNVSEIRDYVEGMGMDLVGRFSEFSYLNMDACIRNAIEKVKTISSSGQTSASPRS